jgi:hypothetical protein
MRISTFRRLFGVGILVCAIVYSALALIEPRKAFANSCCAIGQDCGRGNVCTAIISCSAACDPVHFKNGYCLPPSDCHSCS